MLILSPIVLALSVFTAVVYGYLYLLFTTITEVFYEEYSFSQGTVGLTYLGIGIGNLVGVLLFAIVSDRIMKKKSASGEMKPEYRLPPMIPGAFAIPVGCKHHCSSSYFACLRDISVPVRMDSRKPSFLDCANPWYITR
jgi:MFS family permease